MFPAKVSWPFLGIIAGLMLLVTIQAISDKAWFVVALLFMVWVILLSSFLCTRYLLFKNELRIQCGLFPPTKVPVSAIKSITATRNPLSAPAPSFDRLEIRFDGDQCVMVSPLDKDAFVGALLAQNSRISVEWHKPGQTA